MDLKRVLQLISKVSSTENATDRTFIANHYIIILPKQIMKTKTITITVLLTATCLLLVNLLFSFDLFKDEIVKVGWYNSYGENKNISIYSAYTLFLIPFTVCFYCFSTFFLFEVKTYVNKYLGGIAFTLWCICAVEKILMILFYLYVLLNFNGDEMYKSYELFWATTGKSDYPLMWLLLTSDILSGLYFMDFYCHLAAYFFFAIIFALLIRKERAFGITGIVVMAIPFLLLLLSLPYAYLTNLCWIVLCTVVLWRLGKSSSDKHFILQ